MEQEKSKDKSEMTPRERSLANLKPFKPGQSGNPAGRKPGVKNWATIVQNLLGDEELLDKMLTKQPDYIKELPTKNPAKVIVIAMMAQAMNGDRHAADWLRKTGFGEKVTHEAEDGLFQKTKIEVEIVPAKITAVGDSEAESRSTE